MAGGVWRGVLNYGWIFWKSGFHAGRRERDSGLGRKGSGGQATDVIGQRAVMTGFSHTTALRTTVGAKGGPRSYQK